MSDKMGDLEDGPSETNSTLRNWVEEGRSHLEDGLVRSDGIGILLNLLPLSELRSG